MDLDVPISAFESGTQSNAKGKRKASSIIDLTEDNHKTIKARTLGGDRPVQVHVPKPISSWSAGPPTSQWASGSAMGRMEPVLPAPSLLSYISSEIEGSNDVLEAKNVEEDGTTFSLVIVSLYIADCRQQEKPKWRSSAESKRNGWTTYLHRL